MPTPHGKSEMLMWKSNKNDYELAYFWIKYNDYSRGFNQSKHLKELIKILDKRS